MVVNPIMVNNFASLFGFTPAGRVSDSMTETQDSRHGLHLENLFRKSPEPNGQLTLNVVGFSGRLVDQKQLKSFP